MEITGEKLKQTLDGKGIKHKRLADFIPLKPDQLSKVFNGTRQLSAKETDRVREFLAELGIERAGASPHSIVIARDGTGELTASTLTRNVTGQERQTVQSLTVPSLPVSNRKLPVLGTAVGGAQGSFVMNGEVVDYKPSPAALEHVQGAFIVRATGDSMYPRFIEGELLAIDPHRPIRKDDFVLVELHGHDGVPGDAFIKKFKGYAGNNAALEQFNPPAKIKIDRDKIRRIMHIYIEGLS